MKIGRSVIMGATGCVVAGLFGLSIYNLYYRSDQLTGAIIADDVQQLVKIFTNINSTCGIISFDFQQNPINFLNVGSFTSSEVGSMNLTYPDKWEGPYVQDNPEIQGTPYMVVRTNKGYFVTPGDGVELPNNKVIGKDIILDEDADIGAMMYNKEALFYNGRPLAGRMVEFGNFIEPEVAQLSE